MCQIMVKWKGILSSLSSEMLSIPKKKMFFFIFLNGAWEMNLFSYEMREKKELKRAGLSDCKSQFQKSNWLNFLLSPCHSRTTTMTTITKGRHVRYFLVDSQLRSQTVSDSDRFSTITRGTQARYSLVDWFRSQIELDSDRLILQNNKIID